VIGYLDENLNQNALFCLPVDNDWNDEAAMKQELLSDYNSSPHSTLNAAGTLFMVH